MKVNFFWVSILLFLLPQAGYSCLCLAKHNQEFIEKTDLIFEGKVLAYADLAYLDRIIEIEVLNYWKWKEGYDPAPLIHLLEFNSECASGYQVDSTYIFCLSYG